MVLYQYTDKRLEGINQKSYNAYLGVVISKSDKSKVQNYFCNMFLNM